jgi:uncharacterized delta-60 repeat protein/gliding motility-associated-like protein
MEATKFKGLKCHLMGMALAVSLLFASTGTLAQTLTPLHQFDGAGTTGTGARPRGTLVSDGTLLYGLTFEGGVNNEGVLFSISPDGLVFTKLHEFINPTSGANPFLSLVSEGTFLYGTTSIGGSSNFGTVFRINKDGTGFTTLHHFNGTNGNGPLCTMALQGTFLYGTTSLGGANNAGVFFRINTDGTGYTVMHHFGGTVSGNTNGMSPQGSLLFNANFVYGTTSQGGSAGDGIVYKIDVLDGIYSILHHFTNEENPRGGLVYDGTYLYGMAFGGGTPLVNVGYVYQLLPNGTNFFSIFDFDFTTGGAPEGELLLTGETLYGLLRDYGTNNAGVLFNIQTSGAGFKKIHEFDGTTTGSEPVAGLISDGATLYGMTNRGGANNLGTVFSIKPTCIPPTEFTALQLLYESTDGPQWANNANWLTPDPSTWHGVTITGCAVTEVVLGDNGLTGNLPFEIGNLTDLQVLDLNENFLTGDIPNTLSGLSQLTKLNLSNNGFTFMPNLTLGLLDETLLNLNVSSNALDFGDLEPNMSFVNFNYASQENLPPGDVVPLIEGENLILNLSTGGSANAYQWFKGGVPLTGPGSTDPTYIKPGATTADLGDYHVEVTNTNLPALILQSKTYYVIPVPCPTGLSTTGGLDPTFQPDIVGGYTTAAVESQGTNKVLMSMSAATVSGQLVDGIVRLNNDGSLDNTFSAIDYYPGPEQLVVMTDETFFGMIVTVHSEGISTSIHRLQENGTPDVAFISASPSIDYSTITALTEGRDGQIVFSVVSTEINGMLRLNADGTLDNSFQSDWVAKKIKVQTDDKVVFINGGRLYRLMPDGSDDATFNLGSGADDEITDFAIQADGKIVVIGYFTELQGQLRYGIARLNTDGSLDDSFAPWGFTHLSPILFEEVVPEKVLVMNDGKILIGGRFQYVNAAPRSQLVRLNTDGTVDCIFKQQSTLTRIRDFAIRPDRRIYVSDLGLFGEIYIERLNNAIAVIQIAQQPADAIVCDGNVAQFTTAASGTIGITFHWQYSPDGAPLSFVDIVDGTTYTGTTTATLSVNTSGNVGAGRYRCRINGTFADEVFTNDEGLFINPLPTAPTATGASNCGAGSVTLGANGGASGQYRWYAVATGGTSIAGETNSAYTTPSLTATTTYHVAINNGTCESVRTPVTATINAIPTAPTTTGASACGGSTVTLNASGGANGQYRWYTVDTGGTSITGELNNSYTTPSLTTTTTYYVSIDNGTCESVRTSVMATINPLPTAPTTTGATVCSPSTATLNASGATNGQYRWYTVANGGTPIAGQTNSTFTTPSLAATTTYYVSIHTGTCESTRTAVTATVTGACNQPPVINATAITVQVQGSATISLAPLLSDPDNNLNLASLRVAVQPTSGAVATIDASQNLQLNYSGINFSGTDHLTIEVCDLLDVCSQQDLNIEVVGEMITYNAVSPGDDGKNDIFFLEYIDILQTTKDNRVTIFNRWGDVVFDVENYDNVNRVFRGLSNDGKELPSGIYFYKIVFLGGAKSVDGFISLRR